LAAAAVAVSAYIFLPVVRSFFLIVAVVDVVAVVIAVGGDNFSTRRRDGTEHDEVMS
jgi:hypothetical protein